MQGVFSEVEGEFKKMTSADVKLKLDSGNPLGDGCGGGVEIYVNGGKIRVTNTLDTRMSMACNDVLPAIRNILFGIGAGSRAFFD